MKPADIINIVKSILRGNAGTESGHCAASGNTDSLPCNNADPAEFAGGPGMAEAQAAGSEAGWDQIVECFQIGFMDFTTDRESIGFRLDPENRWIKLAADVFYPEMDDIYAQRLRELRSSTRGKELAKKLGRLKQSDDVAAYWKQLELPFIDKAVQEALQDSGPAWEDGGETGAGRPPFSFRLVFGILIAQKLLGLSDRGICRVVSESPYLQYFLGYTSFSTSNTIAPSNITRFKKRLDVATMQRLNDILIQNKRHARELAGSLGTPASGTGNADIPKPMENGGEDGSGLSDKASNSGTLILDATCGPVNIRFPQDFSILNEGRMCLEKIIEGICRDHSFEKPRTYIQKLQAEFLKLAKSKTKRADDLRHVIRLELNAVARNLRYIDKFLRKEGVSLTSREIERIQVIRAVHAQQKYLFTKKAHTVQNRIVSISMPFIRPIKRGKAKHPTEFGPKYDIAVDGDGYSWLTNFSFSSFNEGQHLIDALKGYKQKTGHYPARVLVDQIYRSTGNIQFCKEHGIRISGPRLGRKPKDKEILKEMASIERQDMVDRIEVERHFSRDKRCFGIECIVERTTENVGYAVGMSVFLDNVVPVGF